jgi:DGQHR domain-containing protein
MNIENYYSIDVNRIKQFQSGIVLIGKLKFEELLTIHRLTERKESLEDPFGENKTRKYESDEEFQRQLSTNKLNAIASYLSKEFNSLKEGRGIGVFPTSIIISLDYDVETETDNINVTYLKKAYNTDLKTCFISDEVLYIPKNKKIALIVDGQHRFYGVMKFYESLKDKREKEIINDFEFITTFIIGFDIYEVGKVFATVNFTQKPVNRSLYYDIFGSVPDQKSDIKLAHDLALHLNNNAQSPLQNMIKMLGKGYGLFSQSFFVEKLLIHFRADGVWENIYADYLADGFKYKTLSIFMRIYLNCVREAYPSAWPQRTKRDSNDVYSAYDYNYILCKTSGMGAILRLIKDIYPLVEAKIEEDKKYTISNIFKKIPDKEASLLFSRAGDYGISAGEGLQKKLYKYLKNRLGV